MAQSPANFLDTIARIRMKEAQFDQRANEFWTREIFLVFQKEYCRRVIVSRSCRAFKTNIARKACALPRRGVSSK